MSRQVLWRVIALAGILGCGVALFGEVSGQDSKPEPPKAPPGGAPKVPSEAPKSPPTSPPGAGAPATGDPKAVQGQPATVNVQCPANATIWIEGQKMTSTGAVRSFQSPALEAGKAFYYSFKVSWPGAPGQPDTVVEREVTVRAGQTTVLDFRPQGTFGPPIMSQPSTGGRYSSPGIFRREGSHHR
jgi:uncharacterized protein (TIGR03000 family)